MGQRPFDFPPAPSPQKGDRCRSFSPPLWKILRRCDRIDLPEGFGRRRLSQRGECTLQCPVCGKEMKTGASTFMGSTGLTPMACVFTDSEVKQKGFFRHNVVSKVLLQGDDIETYFCESCQLLLPLIR